MLRIYLVLVISPSRYLISYTSWDLIVDVSWIGVGGRAKDLLVFLLEENIEIVIFFGRFFY